MKKFAFGILCSLWFPINLEAQANTGLSIELEIEYPGHGIKFEGWRLDSNGLYLAKYSLEKRLLRPNTQSFYDSLLLPLADLSPSQLYRLEMFLRAHNFLENVRFNSEEQGCARPVKYQIKHGAQVHLVFDNEYCYDQCEDLNRYIIRELEMLVNDLIPEKYSRFAIPVDRDSCP